MHITTNFPSRPSVYIGGIFHQLISLFVFVNTFHQLQIDKETLTQESKNLRKKLNAAQALINDLKQTTNNTGEETIF